MNNLNSAQNAGIVHAVERRGTNPQNLPDFSGGE